METLAGPQLRQMTSTCSATITFTPYTDTVMRKMVRQLKRADDPVLCGIVYDEFLTSAIALDRLFDVDCLGVMTLTPYAELVALEISHLAHSTGRDVSSKATHEKVMDAVRLGGFEG